MSTQTSRKSDSQILIRSAYSQKPRVQISFSGLGRTKQSFKAECDINQILARFLRTGVLDFTNKNEARYGDVTGLEYQTAVFQISRAKSMFEELPAQLRARFENEPGRFIEFVNNPRNREECVEMGLMKPKANAGASPLPPSHREDGSATHEPLRARDGTYREHTRAEKRAEAKAARQAQLDPDDQYDGGEKTNSPT